MSLTFWRTSHYYKTSVYYLNWLWNEIYLSISVLSRQFSQSKSVPRNDWIEMVEFPWQLMQPLQLGRHSCWNFTQTNYLQPFDKTFLFWVLIEIEQNQFEKLYSTSGIKCAIMILAFNTIVFMKSKTMNLGTFDTIKLPTKNIYCTIRWRVSDVYFKYLIHSKHCWNLIIVLFHIRYKLNKSKIKLGKGRSFLSRNFYAILNS